MRTAHRSAKSSTTGPGLAFHPLGAVTAAAESMNEDDYGTAGSYAAWVIDGGTSTTKRLVDGRSPAAWLANTLSAELTGLRHTDLREALRNAIDATREKYERLVPLNDIQPPPSAAISLVGISGNELKVLSLGDVSVAILDKATSSTKVLHGGKRTLTEKSLERTYTQDLENGVPSKEARERALAVVDERRMARMNRPGGYWIAGLEPKAADHAVEKSLQLEAGDRILIASDGFMVAEEYGVVPHWSEVLLGKKGLSDILREVRSVEEQDPEGRTYARLKKSDDATALLLEVQ
jgi:serine/threonine protein phosphatase PrpC